MYVSPTPQKFSVVYSTFNAAIQSNSLKTLSRVEIGIWKMLSENVVFLIKNLPQCLQYKLKPPPLHMEVYTSIHCCVCVNNVHCDVVCEN